MLAHTRHLIAASVHAFVTGGKVAGLYDHAAGRHVRIAAEALGEHLQGFDGERSVRFGGTLPELYDAKAKAHISMAIEGDTARGYDRASATAYDAVVNGRSVQVYDHGEGAWFAFDIQVA